ncbi:DUF3795 domain-containing protein [Lachnospiraceae bacterium NSJ-143]|nr:DUF3795 domain-containing protein [Lachnospiraceae bacterium NSJ-143]
MSKNEVSCCGVVCTDCIEYKNGCEGCRSIEGKVEWAAYLGKEVCPFYQCCVNEHGYITCAECEKLPCEMFYNVVDPNCSREEFEREFKARLKNLGREK